jgi:uncharacterized repeat protein (TIGR03809 family)
VIRASCIRVSLFAGWFMTSRFDVAKGREIVARWCYLAEQRLEYLTELFDSGRWRRFYDGQQAFLADVREARNAVQAWRDLLSREGSRDSRPAHLSWLARGQTILPKSEFRREAALPPRVPAIPIPAIPIAPPQEMPAVSSGEAVNEAASAEPLPQDAFAATLDTASIAARYPLLRNTF